MKLRGDNRKKTAESRAQGRVFSLANRSGWQKTADSRRKPRGQKAVFSEGQTYEK